MGWWPEEGEDQALWHVKHTDGDEVSGVYAHDIKTYLYVIYDCMTYAAYIRLIIHSITLRVYAYVMCHIGGS